MAEHDTADKTEQPTPKRLREAREKGQVPRSRELSAALVMSGAGTTLALGLGGIGEHAIGWMREALRVEVEIHAVAPALDAAFCRLLVGGLMVVSPVLIVCLLVALLAPALIGGWNFSVQALQPQWSRLDPIKGLGRVFSSRGLMELLKALLKFLVVGTIAVVSLLRMGPELLALSSMSGATGLVHGMWLVALALLWCSAGLLLIAGIDVPFQLWQHHRQLRMTRQEVRDEFKETEGSPEVRGRLRRMQEEAARRGMLKDVPTADVVVTNPAHFAVALRYREGRDRAPVVVARGGDLLAMEIRRIAEGACVPVVEQPMLARALYHNCRVGQEIPVVLYAAVAQLLGYVMQLAAGVRDASLPRIAVPEELTVPAHERGRED